MHVIIVSCQYLVLLIFLLLEFNCVSRSKIHIRDFRPILLTGVIVLRSHYWDLVRVHSCVVLYFVILKLNWLESFLIRDLERIRLIVS